MRRLLTIVSDQSLPNFIAVNEERTRPEALHVLYTPTASRMVERWRLLRGVLQARFPGLELHEHPVDNAYDMATLRTECTRLLDSASDAEWEINVTCGTKITSLCLGALCTERGLPALYVETPGRRTLRMRPDRGWMLEELPHTERVDLQTYFEIYGRRVTCGKPRSGQEKAVFDQLGKLDWGVWSSVELWAGQEKLAEYDAVAIDGYQVSFFECKRMLKEKKGAGVKRPKPEARRRKQNVRLDLLKLYQVREAFGGPFGRSYWVLSGGYELSEVDEQRIASFGIRLIRSGEIQQLSRDPGRFNLPPRRGGRPTRLD